MSRSIVRGYVRNPLLAGACIVVGLAGCSSGDKGTGTTLPAIGTGGIYGAGGVAAGGAGATPATTGTGGTPTTSAGGTPVGNGGATPVGNGGTTPIGNGGTTTTTTGGTSGTAGTTDTAGAGGVGGTGAGGTSGAAGGGGTSGAGPTLVHCDQKSETAAMPELRACGDMTGVKGVDVMFGPAGAQMDVNVGQGFENTDPNDNATCPGFAALFMEPSDETAQLLDVGTQPCTATAPNTGTCLDFKLYSAYHPAIWPSGKIPVISWANGTCAQPEGYGPLLRYVASYGFFVIAANSREVGTGKEVLHALDYAAAANMDPKSPYYGKLDLDKVGVMGHSQGGGATVTAASDSRVKAVIIFNAANSASKPFLAVSGDMDIFATSPTAMGAAVNAASEAAFLYYHNPVGASADSIKGHLVLMLSPERVVEQTKNWWQAVLNNDPTAKMYMENLKSVANDYDYGEHGL
ncbi:MAG TPA: hypothetical protein VHC69_27470 [Polyangiaceae bacterium]|nr:hypothetical protein [Polyangiaceae bacterium]